MAKLEAKEAANNLGMFLEEKNEVLENINDDDEHDEDNDSETNDPIYKENHNEPDENTDEHEASNEMQMPSDTDNLAKDVLELEKAGVVDREFVNNVRKMQEASLKRINSNTIPMFELTSEPTEMSNNKTQSQHSPFLEVKHNSKVVYVRKTSLVWIFQQAEHVSTDHLFRVRKKQPYSTNLCEESKDKSSNDISIRDLATTDMQRN